MKKAAKDTEQRLSDAEIEIKHTAKHATMHIESGEKKEVEEAEGNSDKEIEALNQALQRTTP